jgi:hypothetical protein
MSPTELKMQPTIHLQSKPGDYPPPNPALLSKCIVGCIFSSVGLIITGEISCTFESIIHVPCALFNDFNWLK